MRRKSVDRDYIRKRVIRTIAAVALVLSVLCVGVSAFIFRQYEMADCVEYGRGITRLIAQEIDADSVNSYIAQGRRFPGYETFLHRLELLREAYPDVEFLYVYQIREDGCHVVFDLDSPEFPAGEPGSVVEFDPSFEPFLDDLLAGKEVEPVVSNDAYGYLLTIYTPVYDSKGDCVCYAAADFSMNEIADYVWAVSINVAVVLLIGVAAVAIASSGIAERTVVKPFANIVRKAYRDSLTGLKNKASYLETTAHLDKDISDGIALFAIVMVDVNFLKRVNDTYGHDRGNEYLCNCARDICSVFGKRQTYRIGGDEFVVVLEGNDLLEATYMTEQFREVVAQKKDNSELEPWERVSAAVGMASYIPETDTCAEDVFKRADQAMYENKLAMKAQRTD